LELQTCYKEETIIEMQGIIKIWEDFNQAIRDYVESRIGKQALVDDIVQDVFLKLMNKIATIEEVNDIQPYLFKMAKNTITDHFRAQKKLAIPTNLAQDLDQQKDGLDLNQIISKHCIIPFIENLDSKYKEALMLSEIEKMPQKELAKHLNISYSGAKSRVQRGREKLKESLMACCNFETDSYGNLIKKENHNCC